MPPYVGVKGWLGARIDRLPDWTMIEALVKDAYRLIAPAPLLAMLDAAEATPRRRPRRKKRTR